jgi:hypothetical protein
MTTIVNTNEWYGDAVEFTAATEEMAVAKMQAAVRSCGPGFADVVVTEDDYRVVADDHQ